MRDTNDKNMFFAFVLINYDGHPVCPGSCVPVCSETKCPTTWHEGGTHHVQRSGKHPGVRALSLFLVKKKTVYRWLCVAFNKYTQVTIHGYGNFPSRCLSGAELADSDYLRAVAGRLSTPPALSQTKDDLQTQVMGSVEKSISVIWNYRDIIVSFLFF